MPSYISTLKDDDKTNNILPRTVLKAVADDNGSYLDSGLQASDINYLKNGKAQTIEQKVDNLVTQSITDGDTSHAPSGDAVNDALNAIKELVAITPTYKTENFQFKYKVVYKRAGWAFFSCEVRALSAYSDYRDVAEGLPRPVENFYGGLDGGIFFINSNGKLQYYIGDTSAHYFCISYPCL